MDAGVLLKGIMVGLAVSIPLGPTGVLCVQRTINHGRYSGFFSGLGAATADTIFALIAAFGISFILNFIQEKQSFFNLFGGILIIFIGAKVFRSNPVKKFRKRNIRKNKLVEDFLSVLFYTLSNPMAIFLFIGIYGGMNIALDATNYLQLVYLFLGVFAGAALWWFLLSSLVHRLRDRIRLRRVLWLNRITGSVLFLCGLVAVFTFFLAK